MHTVPSKGYCTMGAAGEGRGQGRAGAQGPLGSWGCEPCLPGPQAVPWMWMHRMSGALLVQGPLPTCLDRETVGGFSLLLSAMSRRAPLYLFP